LPSLIHDFSHAHIRSVSVGPRREVTLAVSPLVWEGHNGRLTDPVPVRFGGVENFAEVSAFFAAGPHERSELAWLRYAVGRRSKPGCLFFELVFERIDARLVIRCSSLQVGPSEQDAEPGATADPGRM
jgi:hypothetical protein